MTSRGGVEGGRRRGFFACGRARRRCLKTQAAPPTYRAQDSCLALPAAPLTVLCSALEAAYRDAAAATGFRQLLQPPSSCAA